LLLCCEFGNLKTFLLALPEQSGPHSGVNNANNVAAIIHHYNLEDKIGYFMTDDVTNNDTFLEELGGEFDFNPVHRRLRCSGSVNSTTERKSSSPFKDG
jgi:hypothetical protein